MTYKAGWQHDAWQGLIQATPAGNFWFSPLWVFRLLGDSSVGRVEALAEFSVAVFQFLPFPAATNDLNMKDDIPYCSSNTMLEHPHSSWLLDPEYYTILQS